MDQRISPFMWFSAVLLAALLEIVVGDRHTVLFHSPSEPVNGHDAPVRRLLGPFKEPWIIAKRRLEVRPPFEKNHVFVSRAPTTFGVNTTLIRATWNRRR